MRCTTFSRTVGVSDRTSRKIAELIPRGVLDAITRLVLVNALYVNAAWAEPFDTRATTNGSFARLDGTTVSAPFMRSSESYRVATGNGWQVVELPYAGDQLAMDVILPDPGRFLEVERMVASGLNGFVAGLTRSPVRYVSDVLHETFIDVTERGTEAAAATAVVTKASAAPVTPRDVLADRPFLFAVRDRETGSVLLLGRVLDPTAR